MSQATEHVTTRRALLAGLCAAIPAAAVAAPALIGAFPPAHRMSARESLAQTDTGRQLLEYLSLPDGTLLCAGVAAIVIKDDTAGRRDMLCVLATTPSETADGVRAKRLALEQANCGEWPTSSVSRLRMTRPSFDPPNLLQLCLGM
jgi:hypothetical protein